MRFCCRQPTTRSVDRDPGRSFAACFVLKSLASGGKWAATAMRRSKHRAPSANADDPKPLSMRDAEACIAAHTNTIHDTENVSIRDALGRILAEDVLAPIDVPARANSALDGYAVGGTDLPSEGDRTFVVVGISSAGTPFRGRVRRGEALRI